MEKKVIFGLLLMFLLVFMPLSILTPKLNPLIIKSLKTSAIASFVSSFPLISIIIFSFLFSIASTFLYKVSIDKEAMEKMKAFKKEQKEMQNKLREEKNPENLSKLQTEMTEKSMNFFMLSMQSMFSPKFVLLSMLPSVYFLFFFLGPLYNAASVGNIIYWHVKLPLVGDGAGWLLSTIIFSMFFSIPIRKIFKID